MMMINCMDVSKMKSLSFTTRKKKNTMKFWMIVLRGSKMKDEGQAFETSASSSS